jgi:hypothetical protein
MWFARKNKILRWALSTATPALKRCPSTVTGLPDSEPDVRVALRPRWSRV